jgi:hypothetical protein
MCDQSISLRLVALLSITVLLFSFTGYAQISPYRIVLKDKTTGQPLSGATVISLDSRFRQASDNTGHITIPYHVIAKEETLQITMIGYKKITIATSNVLNEQQFELEQDAAVLAEVIITNGGPSEKVRDLQMGTETITSVEARKLPSILGEVDIIKLLQLKPGIKSAGEGLAGFYVRGGGADQNLILIDKVPVYNPNHLLGLFSVFNNDAVRDVKLYKAAYPAEYSGRLSSVLDVNMRSGSMDSLSVSGGIGFLSSRLTVEAPITKGKSSFIISGRRTYFDIFTNALNRAYKGDSTFDQIPSYFFSDLNFKADWLVNRNNSISATGYWGSDNFSSPASREHSAKFIWGNKTASLSWKKTIPNKLEILSTGFYSGYNYTLSNKFSFNDLQLRSGINTIGLKITGRTISSRALQLQGGLEGMYHRLRIGDFKASSDLSGFNVGEKVSGNEWGAFLNAEWDDNKSLALLGGLRLSGFYAGEFRINPEPRFAARYFLGERSSLKLSATRMYQYLHLASLSSASLPTDIWYPSTQRTKPQYADQVSLGWSTSIKNNSLFFSVETYYKWMKNQVEFRDGANIFGNPKLENDFVYGEGTAYGVEAYIEKKKGRTTGWIGYTLSWANRTFADINDGQSFRPRYDRRHDLSVVFMHKINKKFSVSGNWIFGSGAYITVPVGRFVFQDQIGDRSTTIIPVYSKRSNYQLGAVHRLDLNLIMTLKSKRGNQDLTFSLYNAYSRRNPFYIQFKEVDNADGFISAIEPTLVSLFPVLPGITYNFKF